MQFDARVLDRNEPSRRLSPSLSTDSWSTCDGATGGPRTTQFLTETIRMRKLPLTGGDHAVPTPYRGA